MAGKLSGNRRIGASPREGVSWTKPTHTALAFDGFSWQMQTNDKNTYLDVIRVGELYISGSNSTNYVSGSMKALPTSFIQLVTLSMLFVGLTSFSCVL